MCTWFLFLVEEIKREQSCHHVEKLSFKAKKKKERFNWKGAGAGPDEEESNSAYLLPAE